VDLLLQVEWPVSARYPLAKTKSRGQRRAKNAASSRSVPPAPQSEYRAHTAENISALRIVRALRGPNVKYINSTFNAINLSPDVGTPSTFLLNGVAQGTSENTRIGRLTRNLWLDLDLSAYSSAFAGATCMRFYVVVESTALGSALAAAQFFLDAANFSPTSQRDRTNRNASRYVVLYDSKSFGLGGISTASGQTAPVTTGTMPAERYFNLHLPLGFQTDYSRGNAGTITDIDSNSLYLVVVADSASTNCTITGGYTLCFRDDQ